MFSTENSNSIAQNEINFQVELANKTDNRPVSYKHPEGRISAQII